jgi:hypothetical protein
MQTTISQYGPAAFLGLLDGVANPQNVISLAAEGAVGIGRAVERGTVPAKQCKVAGTAAAAIGFALHDHAREQSAAGVVQYADKETVSVLTQGRLWIETDDAVVAGAAANLVIAGGKLTDAPVGPGIEAFVGIKVTFQSTTAGPGLAIVEVK